MAISKTTLNIGGWKEKDFNVRSLSLNQSLHRHHNFEILVSLETDFSVTPAVLKAILGEDAAIKIETTVTENDRSITRTCSFNGFVDEINTTWSKSGRMLRVKGFSKTIFLDSAPRFRTFSNQSLGGIFQKIIGGYSNKLPNATQKNVADKVVFAVQSQETDFQFLSRMADNFGKIFCFDGSEIYFGDAKNLPTNKVELTLGKDCQQLDLSQNLAPLHFKMQSYNAEKNKLERLKSQDNFGNVQAVVKAAIDKSKVYPNAEIGVNYLVSTEADLEQSAKKIVARQAHELVMLTASSDNPEIKIGTEISFKSTEKDKLLTEEKYQVIEVNHHVSGDQAYQNSFVAVPANFPFATRQHSGRLPMTGPLMAIVKNHKDPQNLGRVQVEFLGDAEQSLSPWLRVLVSFTKNGGFHFLPEKGEKVMVFFEDFNPEKSPFVLGSFYFKSNDAAEFKDANNAKKGIKSEKIAFRWDDKTGKLVIEAEAIELKAKQKIELKADQSMTFDGGRQLTQKATRIDLN